MPLLLLLGAPTRGTVRNPSSSFATHGYAWHRIPLPSPSNPTQPFPDDTSGSADPLVLPLPHESYAAGHVRLSQLTDLYRGAIFGSPPDAVDEAGELFGEGEEEGESVELILDSRSGDGTSKDTVDASRALSGWLPTPRSVDPDPDRSVFSAPAAQPHESLLSTRSFLTSSSLAESSRSDASFASASIARLPSYHLNPHTITPLSSLPSLAAARHTPPRVTILAGVLEVTGPDSVKLKKGREAGREVGVLRLVVGDQGRVLGVTAWRECARWGEGEGAVRRGDVVLLSNLTVQRATAGSPIALTASPFQHSALTVCYRTLPLDAADRRLRPDLRLAGADRGMEMVRQVVVWVEGMAGIGR
ncbi:hypothetical protein CALCODRAFT_231439 [Calocera cornea HHB12733]|uniref:Shieldin complex subunit 2 first OB fold domain-containing protein n=1 Tax=Calocera cornea HHB12733 TaxID=1353952 RepID=A0A165GZK1_9BASI|nr:hypothetical protein CALCODRAFT_231439 [Calocera cornea HHB12733]